jgi:hypothetical protein
MPVSAEKERSRAAAAQPLPDRQWLRSRGQLPTTGPQRLNKLYMSPQALLSIASRSRYLARFSTKQACRCLLKYHTYVLTMTHLARQAASTPASSSALLPPCPRFGGMGLAASPSSVTAPLLHTGVGSRSKMPTCKQASKRSKQTYYAMQDAGWQY